MLRAILNKSTKQQLYDHLPPITKTIKIRWNRYAGHSWRSRDELVTDVLWWTPSHDRAKAWRPARTYIQHLCVDTVCSPEDLPEAMDDWEGWRERVRDNRVATRSCRWWWSSLTILLKSQVGWGFRIHQLHIQRGVRPHLNECLEYDIKQYDDKASV